MVEAVQVQAALLSFQNHGLFNYHPMGNTVVPGEPEKTVRGLLQLSLCSFSVKLLQILFPSASVGKGVEECVDAVDHSFGSI